MDPHIADIDRVAFAQHGRYRPYRHLTNIIQITVFWPEVGAKRRRRHMAMEIDRLHVLMTVFALDYAARSFSFMFSSTATHTPRNVGLIAEPVCDGLADVN